MQRLQPCVDALVTFGIRIIANADELTTAVEQTTAATSDRWCPGCLDIRRARISIERSNTRLKNRRIIPITAADADNAIAPLDFALIRRNWCGANRMIGANADERHITSQIVTDH